MKTWETGIVRQRPERQYPERKRPERQRPRQRAKRQTQRFERQREDCLWDRYNTGTRQDRDKKGTRQEQEGLQDKAKKSLMLGGGRLFLEFLRT